TLLCLLTVACRLQAAPPVPFEAVYDARYDSYRAEASRSLRLDPDSGHYLLQSQARLRLLGATLTSIEERSEFRWQNDQLLPLQYSFRQRGLGARRRGASFNHAAGLASWQV